MTTTYTIRLVVQGDDKASAPLNQVTHSLGGMQSVMGGILGAAVIQRISSEVLGLGKSGLEAYMNYERLGMSVQALSARELVNAGVTDNMTEALGLAAGQSKTLINWVEKLAILTPFSNEDIGKAVQLGMSYGFTSEQAKRLTADVVDYTSATGKSGETVTRMILSLGQMKSAGKLTGMEIRELAIAGLPVKQILAEAFGVTTMELQKMVEDGLIPADAAFEILARSIEEDFGGAAERQAGTFAGLVTSLDDLQKISLREFFTSTFQAIQPYLQDFVDTLQDPETVAKIHEMGAEFSVFVVDTIEGIKGVVAWWQNLDDGTQDFLIFLGGVIVIGPQVIAVITGIVTTVSSLAGVIAVVKTGWAAWNAGMRITTALGAAGLTPLMLSVGAIAVMVGSVAAIWYTWNVQITKTVQEGQKSVSASWNTFFDKQIASGASATQVLARYNEKQYDVKKVLEETNPIIRLMMGDTESLTQDTAGLADAIAVTAESYGEYKDIMAEAGLEAMLLTESQWATMESQVSLGDQVTDTSQSLLDQSAAFSELTPEMVTAQMEAEKLAQAEEEAMKASRDHAKAYGDLAMQLKDATAAEIARSSLSGLSQALEEGLISPQMYGDAVRNIGLAYGLVNEKSLLLAESLPRLTGLYSSGVIPAENLDDALAELNKQAAAGAVDFDKIIEKFGVMPESLADLEGGVQQSASAITEAAKTAANESIAAFEDGDWRKTGSTITEALAGGVDASSDEVITAMQTTYKASWTVWEHADWFGLGKTLGIAIANGILSVKATIITAAIEVANAAIAAGKAVPQSASYPLSGGGLPALSAPNGQAIFTGGEVTHTTEIHFNGPVTFEVQNNQTMAGLMREMSEA